ncbi:MAG: mannitol dehydrogenase family protein [Bifidobacteriaceae bacterium]|jgi:fructuronate reductase|nr:mannitol dehydrogenase family protein [Bifidobacteriaceae bacterium]
MRPQLCARAAAALPPERQPLVDRARLAPRILHFGLGAFHRAHQAVYTEIGNHATGGDWGIVAVAPSSAATVSRLRAQDCLYSVTDKAPGAPSTRLIGSIIEVLHAAASAERVQSLLASADLGVVTLTVTEKGYARLAGTGRLDTANPAIAADLALTGRAAAASPAAGSGPQGRRPVSVIGHLAFGLARRFHAHRAPLTIVSADNMAGNGPALRQVVLDFITASHWADSAALAAWVADSAAFPETVVDRIVPATTDSDRAAAEAALGLEDSMAVVGEPYRQWVIEDSFATARPPWQAAGAQFTADVAPFALTKLRLLNGAHSVIAYLGLAAGLDTVDQTMRTAWGPSLVRALAAEVAATLPPGGPDPAAYAEELISRFANPAIKHQLRQIASDGSLKVQERWLTPLRQLRRAARPVDTLVLALAAWAAATRPDGGRGGGVSDPKAERFAAIWASAGSRGDGIGQILTLVGAPDLAADGELIGRVAARMESLAAEGAPK